MYENNRLTRLFEYQPTRIIPSNQTQQQLLTKLKQPFIAVDKDLSLYSVYTLEELHHECCATHNAHYCKNKNILTRVANLDCILVLYRKEKQKSEKNVRNTLCTTISANFK